MRWKLIRRRLSVAAPRVIVRSHLPWPLRWAVAAVVFGFSAAIALWAFEFGRDIAGLDVPRREELAQLRSQLQELREERERAQSIANAADGLMKAEQAAQERLARDLQVAETRIQALEADLAFFEQLLPAGNQPLQVRALHAEAPMRGQVRYQVLLMQSGRNAPEFKGRYDIALEGTLDGRPWSATLPGGPRPLVLRQYTRLDGLIDHPPDAVLKTVQARVMDAQGAVRATETVRLP